MQADFGGSGFYRVTEPARVVRDISPDTQIFIAGDVDVEAVRYQDGRVEVTEVKTDVDVLVLQRPMTQAVSEVARVARQQGIKIVVDIDDDFHNVHPQNVAADSTDPHKDQWHNRLWLMRTVGFSHVVTVSTPALLKYTSNNRLPEGPCGVVVRNWIPERALQIQANADAVDTVGWTGTMQTHPRDVVRARGALAQVHSPFVVVGDDTGVATALGIRPDRVTLVPWLDSVEQYWQAMADSFGIGIAPLEPSKFNRSKSWLKPAEYCALGIPFVVSPVPEYQEIVHQAGGGLTAASEGRWGKAIASVHADREQFAAAGKRWATEHTLENHAGEWLAAWQLAAEAK